MRKRAGYPEAGEGQRLGHPLTQGGGRAGVAVRELGRELLERPAVPHSPRHTNAVRNARHGGSVETLRRLLGHSRVATTGRYLDHLGMTDLRDALAPLPRYEVSPA